MSFVVGGALLVCMVQGYAKLFHSYDMPSTDWYPAYGNEMSEGVGCYGGQVCGFLGSDNIAIHVFAVHNKHSSLLASW